MSRPSHRLPEWITIVDVMRHLGVEVTRELSWSVGARVRDLFEMRHGALPRKELRLKTDGSGGTHCFAVYPVTMWDDIEKVILAHEIDRDRQGRLF